uniref:Uncharacterized protein n=1 Tax=Caenorhabditis japonica TaxID=281687 RepID=A0A8R1EK93_CAEJA
MERIEQLNLNLNLQNILEDVDIDPEETESEVEEEDVEDVKNVHVTVSPGIRQNAGDEEEAADDTESDFDDEIPLGISQIVSCPTQLFASVDKSADSTNLNASRDEQMEKANQCVASWKECADRPEDVREDQMKVFNCISAAFEFIESEAEKQEICVLVTGSLHLVGGVLNLIHNYQKPE